MVDADDYLRPPATLEDLSPRQLAVAALIARAKPPKQIAAELGMDCRSYRRHVTALVYVLQLDPSRDPRVQIALWWREHAPISLPPAA